MIKLTIEEELNLAQKHYDNHQYKEAHDLLNNMYDGSIEIPDTQMKLNLE